MGSYDLDIGSFDLDMVLCFQDEIRFELTDDAQAQEFYYIGPISGKITIKKLLSQGTQPSDTVSCNILFNGHFSFDEWCLAFNKFSATIKVFFCGIFTAFTFVKVTIQNKANMSPVCSE